MGTKGTKTDGPYLQSLNRLWTPSELHSSQRSRWQTWPQLHRLWWLLGWQSTYQTQSLRSCCSSLSHKSQHMRGQLQQPGEKNTTGGVKDMILRSIYVFENTLNMTLKTLLKGKAKRKENLFFFLSVSKSISFSLKGFLFDNFLKISQTIWQKHFKLFFFF